MNLEILNSAEAFVLYKFPKDKKFNLLKGKWSYISSENESEKLLKPGFLLAPFNPKEHLFLHINEDQKKEGEIPENLNEILRQFLPQPLELKASTKNYQALVQKGIDEINKSSFEKLVLSRNEVLKTNAEFDYKKFLHNLSEEFPECFTYLVCIPYLTCWLGATPELLVDYNPKRKFKTVALAGTLSVHEKKKGKKWTQKEKNEQAMVTQFISEELKSINIDRLKISRVKDYKTGDLIHLKTDIEFPSSELKNKSAFDIINVLHPTPAISGLPQKNAIMFIEENEGYDRQYYSGYAGLINDREEMKFFVNLRCMQLYAEHAILYAGAGITKDSLPQKEHEETSRKINALKQFVNASTRTL